MSNALTQAEGLSSQPARQSSPLAPMLPAPHRRSPSDSGFQLWAGFKSQTFIAHLWEPPVQEKLLPKLALSWSPKPGGHEAQAPPNPGLNSSDASGDFLG